MNFKLLTCATAAAVLLAACASSSKPEAAGCPGAAEVQALASAYAARQPAANPPPMSAEAGICGRNKLVRQLETQALGSRVGYKAGLTNPAVQKRFNYDRPVLGVLFANMLLPNGAVVDAKFGARPLHEADMLVRVSDERINQARTPAEVLAAIDQVIPFIELPDLVVQDPSQLSGPQVNYINVGARLGVVGQPIAPTPDLLDKLASMKVTLIDADGKAFDGGTGSDILGHPLNAVIWMAQDLAAQGQRLRKGELLSLGSFSKLHPPKAGQRTRVVYEGLPGNPSVSVSFK